jgi:hypothetical protein
VLGGFEPRPRIQGSESGVESRVRIQRSNSEGPNWKPKFGGQTKRSKEKRCPNKTFELHSVFATKAIAKVKVQLGALDNARNYACICVCMYSVDVSMHAYVNMTLCASKKMYADIYMCVCKFM